MNDRVETGPPNGKATSTKGTKRGWDEYLVPAVLLLAGLLLVMQMSRGPGGEADSALTGSPLPDLSRVEGWLNVEQGRQSAEIAATLASDKLLLVDCWATWCGPCVQSLPRLATIAKTYAPQGVRFVGLTREDVGAVPRMERLIESTPGFTWPIGYGAEDFMQRMGVNAIPTLILFRDNRVVWSSVGGYGLEAALDAELAR